MRITDQGAMLSIGFAGGGVLHPALLWDEQEVVLVDAGFPGQFSLFEQAIEEEGFSVERVTKIILTHEDMDHIGCAKDFLEKNPNIRIMAHQVEAPHIDGSQLPSKMLASAQKKASFSEEEEKQWERKKADYLARCCPVNDMLTDGQVLPYCGSIRVIHTPGHTPGHICLLVGEGNLLITGDGLNVRDQALQGPAVQHTMDMDLALASLVGMADLPIQRVISYHGGYFEGDFRQALAVLLEETKEKTV